MGTSYQQEVDLLTLFKDVAGEYVTMVTAPEQVDVSVDRAIRIAGAEHTVTCLIFPSDVQEKPAVEAAHAFKMAPGSVGFAWPDVAPPGQDLDRAAEVLNAGERVAVLVGQGARDAEAEVMEVADRLGAGVAKALLGKDVLPDDLPYVTGTVGLLGTRPSYRMMAECDTLLMIGSSFPYSQFLPEWDQARGVQIDIDPRMIGIRFPMEVNLVGDAKTTLDALLPRLEPKRDGSWRAFLQSEIDDWTQVTRARALTDANPINPQRVFYELSPRLPEGCLIAADSGSSTNWYARDVHLRRGMRASLSGTLATMGSAVPYAIGAKVAYPSRPVVALAGDGAMQMNGMAELLTVAKYWKQWENPCFVVLVLHNNDLNQVTWEQRAMAGDPKFEASQNIPDFDYAAYAQLCGLEGIRVEEPDAIGDAWDRAFAARVPTVIDAVVDPDVPPIPPHLEWQQAKAVMRALLHGDPDAAGIIRHLTKQSLVGAFPERG
jgi:pyruvate dehydrogenase (quinone)